jgi:hypothetical protein
VGKRTAAKRKPAQEPLVNPFAAQHGIFERNMRFVINRGGTAIDRWKRDGLLSETQQAAILHCQRLWHVIDRGPRLVANLDRTVFGSHGGGHPREVEARDDLHRIKSGFPLQFWDVFENVCRHDEPAGTAGSRLANDSRSASSAARTVVSLIADTIYMRERLSY